MEVSSSSLGGKESSSGPKHSHIPRSSAIDIEPGRKRLIVCCDGTTNDGVNTDKPITNVAKIARCIKNDHIITGNDGSRTSVAQVVMYMRGVATGTSALTNAVDGFYGRGIGTNIREAYAFLCLNWNPGDEIVLIGFSRGAFTVRVLAELVNDIGLLKKEGLQHLNELYQSWKSKRAAGPCSDFEHHEKSRTGVRIKVCAVWDTVAALQGNRLSFVNESIPECVELARHALALDEERYQFRPLLWKDANGLKLRQCWFLGTHSDVGGGSDEQGLANISLMWMISQLQHALGFDDNVIRSLTSDPIMAELARKRSKGVRSSTMSQAHPTDGSYELELALPVQDFQDRTGIRVSTFAKAQRLAGWHYRKPFNSGAKTRESLHWTVGVLIQKGIVAPCKPLELAIDDAASLHDNDPRLEVRENLELELIKTWIAHHCLQLARMNEENKLDLPSKVLPLYLVLLRPNEWVLETVVNRHANLALHIRGVVCFKAHSDRVRDDTWKRLADLSMDASVSRTIEIWGSSGVVEFQWSPKFVTLKGRVQVPFDPSLCLLDQDTAFSE